MWGGLSRIRGERWCPNCPQLFGSTVKQPTLCTYSVSLPQSLSSPLFEQTYELPSFSNSYWAPPMCHMLFLEAQHSTVNKIVNRSVLMWPQKLFTYL